MAKKNDVIKQRVTPTNLSPEAQELLKEMEPYEGLEGKMSSEKLSDIVTNRARDKYGMERVTVYRGKDGVHTAPNQQSSSNDDTFLLDKIMQDEQKQLTRDYMRARIDQMRAGFVKGGDSTNSGSGTQQSMIQQRMAQMMDLNMMQMMMNQMGSKNNGSSEEIRTLKDELRRMRDEIERRNREDIQKMILDKDRQYSEERNRLMTEFKTDKGISAKDLLEIKSRHDGEIQALRNVADVERQKRLEERYENTLKELREQLSQNNSGRNNITELSENIKQLREVGELLGLNKSDKAPKDKTELLMGVVQNGVEALAKAYAAQQQVKSQKIQAEREIAARVPEVVEPQVNEVINEQPREANMHYEPDYVPENKFKMKFR